MTPFAPDPTPDDRAIAREALRLYRRYQLEFVERLRLCPWAERARSTGRVSEEVLMLRTGDPGPVLAAIDRMAERESLEVGLLLFPCLPLDRPAFERFVALVVTAYSARHEVGRAPFALAAFHPDARPDTSDPERLIPFIRRTPDPTIQLVRLTALERVRKGDSEGTQFVDVRFLATLGASREETRPLRERIARDNLLAIERVGLAEVEALLDDIARDRRETYRRLGVTGAR